MDPDNELDPCLELEEVADLFPDELTDIDIALLAGEDPDEEGEDPDEEGEDPDEESEVS